MTFDDDSADLMKELLTLIWFMADQWSSGTEAPEFVEEQRGDFMDPFFRAAAELRKAGYKLPDIDFKLQLEPTQKA